MRIARKILRFVLWTVLGLTVLIVLAYWEEDWRGARDWAECQKELAARGESLDLRQLCPPGKPEDDLSKVPIFAEVYRQPLGFALTALPPPRLDRIKIDLGSYNPAPKLAAYLDGQSQDLVSWQNFYLSAAKNLSSTQKEPAAQTVLQALSSLDPGLGEVSNALKNPQAFFPIDYGNSINTRWGPQTKLLTIAKIIDLRGAAHLQNNQIDAAASDYFDSFTLDRALSKNCFMISYVVIAAVRTLDNSILWEGLHRKSWNKIRLSAMEQLLAETDFLVLAKKSYRIERAGTLQTIGLIQRKLYDPNSAINATFPVSFLELRPRGWWDRDRSAYCRMVQQQIDSIDVSSGYIRSPYVGNSELSESVFPDGENNRFSFASFVTPFTQLSTPFDQSLIKSIAKAESYRRLARIACRLEEYWIDHHQYPDHLDELPNLPPHLNQEVLSMNPLHYWRKGDSYVLYSTGWDRKDHGGVRQGKIPNGEGGTMTGDLDWTWPGP